jgi:hypothetical protein
MSQLFANPPVNAESLFQTSINSNQHEASANFKCFSWLRTAGEDFLELVKSALLAALEALPPAALFGLVTFSHKLGLYDVQGDVPVVKNVAIPPSADSALPLDLDDVMPLEALLAPVSGCESQSRPDCEIRSGARIGSGLGKRNSCSALSGQGWTNNALEVVLERTFLSNLEQCLST